MNEHLFDAQTEAEHAGMLEQRCADQARVIKAMREAIRELLNASADCAGGRPLDMAHAKARAALALAGGAK